MGAALIDERDQFERKRIELGDTQQLGRVEGYGNDIVLPQATVGRRHARIVRVGTQYRLDDIGSPSGCFVNDERIPAEGCMLRDGDRVQIGGVVLRFEQHE